MSVRVMAAVWADSPRKGNDLVVLLALADWANEDGVCWPAIDSLAHKARLSDRGVQKILTRLKDEGDIEVHQGGFVSGKNRTNTYRILTGRTAFTPPNSVHPPPEPASSPPPVNPEFTTGNRQEEPPLEPPTEEGEQSPPEQHLPGMEPPEPAPDPMDEKVNDVWNHYFTVFGDRLKVKTLTPARARQLRKAITAVAEDVPLCKRAIDGLKSYCEQHPDRSQDISLGRIFETGPHSRSNLTDQIEWWAQQSTSVVPGGHSKIPVDLTGVPSVTRGTIHNRRGWAKEWIDAEDPDEFVERRGQEALGWLREQCGHEPIVQDGKVTGWREVTE